MHTIASDKAELVDEGFAGLASVLTDLLGIDGRDWVFMSKWLQRQR
jgi:hypothetical protein